MDEQTARAIYAARPYPTIAGGTRETREDEYSAAVSLRDLLPDPDAYAVTDDGRALVLAGELFAVVVFDGPRITVDAHRLRDIAVAAVTTERRSIHGCATDVRSWKLTVAEETIELQCSVDDEQRLEGREDLARRIAASQDWKVPGLSD
jgi:hypothetical protein